MYVVNINYYAYVIPFVDDVEKDVHFLKTIFPDRKDTKIYLTQSYD